MGTNIITKGLNIPIKGEFKQKIKLGFNSQLIGMDLSGSMDLVLKPSVKVGDIVKAQQILACDVREPRRKFRSPAAGKILEIRRNRHRRIETIVIEKTSDEIEPLPEIPRLASKDETLEYLLNTGLISHLRQRPFDCSCDPNKLPRTIFVSCVDSNPLTPDAKYDYEGHEEAFQKGIDALSQFAKVYLVYENPIFLQISGCHHFEIKGKHPKGNASVHIAKLDPILGLDDSVWTTGTFGVTSIGKAILENKLHLRRIISLAGEGIEEDSRKLYDVDLGCNIDSLVKNKLLMEHGRLISGDPLNGSESKGFLKFDHRSIVAIPEKTKGQMLYFMRGGSKVYTKSHAYLSSFLRKNKRFSFSTAKLGDERAFVDGGIYDRVTPLRIPVEALIKAILGKDFEMAVELGLLEVAPEDFALAEFICPSKVPFTKIVTEGIEEYRKILSS